MERASNRHIHLSFQRPDDRADDEKMRNMIKQGASAIDLSGLPPCGVGRS